MESIFYEPPNIFFFKAGLTNSALVTEDQAIAGSK
jgi:hypothetical protein